MMTLYCVIVGVAGSAFPVDIEISEKTSVGHLKKAIWEEIKEKFIHDDKFRRVIASDLQLFLAKAGRGNAWLSSVSDDVKKLKKGEKSALVEALTQEEKELQGESGLKKVLAGMPLPSIDEIHVLVVVPEQGTSAPIVSQELDAKRLKKTGKHTLGSAVAIL
ncbi:unnamed protein product [Phytophthora lilii]|uniref:Unnamed protein product n=1 Tax=Phytophthora lilii TaxID=2077276 RepID=A0A9W6XC56_9STRA|nr:unnamed protein product [Phytophthora lilii]